jgi:hypothetical protein
MRSSGSRYAASVTSITVRGIPPVRTDTSCVRRILAVAVIVVCAALAAPAYAAAPRYILVSGPGLTRPVLLGDWNENLRFLVSLVDAEKLHAFRAAGRPRYRLAMFWGVPAKPVPSRPRDANQHAWFYPAHAGRPAVVDLVLSGELAPRVASPEAQRILARHGIPTRR